VHIKKVRGEREGVVKEGFVTHWFANYFSGTSRKPFPWKSIDLPDATPFQKKVWRALWEIPYGKTVTYGELAKKIGHKGASRAVGSANKLNPLPILIPCHRVIAAGGKLGGYTPGVAIKKKLLEIEGKSL